MKLKKNAFTLMEVLAVIVILGILVGLAVSGYSNYVVKSRNKSYNIAENSLKDAATSAITDCLTENGKNREFCKTHDVLANQYEHEIVLLEELINDDYMDAIRDPYDTEKFCNTGSMEEDGSYVYIINKTNTDNVNNIDFNYKVCLKCGNYKSKDCLGKEDFESDGFDAECKVTYVDGSDYNWVWTDQDLYLKFSANGKFRYGLKFFQYKMDNGEFGDKIEPIENQATIHLNKTINNQKITMRAVDGLGTEKTAKCGTNGIKIDKEKIISATLTGTLKGNGRRVIDGGWAGDDVILKVTPNPKSVPSGYYYEWYYRKEGSENFELLTKSTEDNYLVEAILDNKFHEYKVLVRNGVGNQEVWTNTLKIRFDKTKPTIKAIKNPLQLKKDNKDYMFIDNVTYTFGDSGGTASCNIEKSKGTGAYDVRCTAIGNNQLTAQTTFRVRHYYNAVLATRTVEKCKHYWGHCQNYGYGGDSASNEITCICGDESRRETSAKSGCCEHEKVQESYYTCPYGGTLSGSTCYWK